MKIDIELEVKNIRLISVNIDGVKLDRTFIAEELEEDFWNECEYVPSNDDEIKLIEVDGLNITNIIEREGDTLVFWDIVKYFGWNKRCYIVGN